MEKELNAIKKIEENLTAQDYKGSKSDLLLELIDLTTPEQDNAVKMASYKAMIQGGLKNPSIFVSDGAAIGLIKDMYLDNNVVSSARFAYDVCANLPFFTPHRIAQICALNQGISNKEPPEDYPYLAAMVAGTYMVQNENTSSQYNKAIETLGAAALLKLPEQEREAHYHAMSIADAAAKNLATKNHEHIKTIGKLAFFLQESPATFHKDLSTVVSDEIDLYATKLIEEDRLQETADVALAAGNVPGWANTQLMRRCTTEGDYFYDVLKNYVVNGGTCTAAEYDKLPAVEKIQAAAKAVLV